jgi:hypothetical protein
MAADPTNAELLSAAKSALLLILGGRVRKSNEGSYGFETLTIPELHTLIKALEEDVAAEAGGGQVFRSIVEGRNL